MGTALQSFELQVLLAMVRLGPETYSVPLVLAIEKQAARPVAPAAVFITLGRLEKKGLVSSRLDRAASNHPRRYVKLTKAGLAAVREHRAEHARMWRGLSKLLDSAKL